MPDSAPLLTAEGAAAPAGGDAAFIRTADGRRIRVALWPGGERGSVLLLTGRTEFIEKFYEPIARFQELGWAVATLDWRGQGLSDRLLPDPRKGYVADFADYQRDLDALMAHAAARSAPKPWIIAAHSMGGAVAARALMRQADGGRRRRYGGPLCGPVSAAILSAPMLGIRNAAGLRGAAVRLLSTAGWARAYVPGGGPETAEDQGFDGNVLTSDANQYRRFTGFLGSHEGLRIGSPTWGWLAAALRETARLRPTPTPTLVLLGDAEAVVSPAAIERYARRGDAVRLVRLPGARHEPFIETPAVRERMWRAITSFLDETNL